MKTQPRNMTLRIFFCLGLTALEEWCLAMIGLVFLAFLAYIVILAWLRTRLIYFRVRYVVIMNVTSKPSSSFCLHRHTCLASNQVNNNIQCSNTHNTYQRLLTKQAISSGSRNEEHVWFGEGTKEEDDCRTSGGKNAGRDKDGDWTLFSCCLCSIDLYDCLLFHLYKCTE